VSGVTRAGTTTWRLVDLLDNGDNAPARVQRIEAAGEFDTFEAALEAAKRWGHNVSTGTISRHRKGMCSCGKQH